jgi:hypothetical protein
VLELHDNQPRLIDLNPTGGSIPDGYIHHLDQRHARPNVTVTQVQSVLEDYSHREQIYARDVRYASATRVIQDDHPPTISEQTDKLLHYALDMHFRVRFQQVGDFRVAESRALHRPVARRQRPWHSLAAKHVLEAEKRRDIDVCRMPSNFALAQTVAGNHRPRKIQSQGFAQINAYRHCTSSRANL